MQKMTTSLHLEAFFDLALKAAFETALTTAIWTSSVFV